MDPPACFSSLPPELVDKICHDSDLRKKDLIALRLTSKSHGIYLSASEQLAKRYLTDILLVYTRYSLQAFVEICTHPIFGPAVRKVRLSYARFVTEHFEEEIKDMFPSSWSGYSSQERHDRLDSIRLLVNRCDEEEDLEESGDDETLLFTAFTALSQWHNPLKLGVASDESGALGYNRLYSPDDLGENERWGCDILGTVALLCRAASSGECVVQRFEIVGYAWGDLTNRLAGSLAALAQTSELELDIWFSSNHKIMAQATGLDSMMTSLLENSVGLKILHLDMPTRTHHGYIRKAFSTMSTMRLEEITITGIDLASLWFFKKRMDSLRHLTLYNCEIDISLKSVLLSVQKNCPRLEYFWLSSVSCPWAPNGIAEFQGIQEVEDGINKLIQSEAELD